jgi:hypothetical protein
MADGIRQQKLHPTLRMIQNGDDEVNAQRAAQSPNVVSTLSKATLVVPAPPDVTSAMTTMAIRAAKPPAPAKPSARKRLKGREAKHAYVGVFVEVHRDRQVGGPAVTAQDVENLKADIRKTTASAPGASKVDTCLLGPDRRTRAAPA